MAGKPYGIKTKGYEVNARAHVYVSGRVQGVYFRSHARNKAHELGLVGWVRNMADGRVGAVFEGDDGDVKRMVEWCRTGEGFARVDNVEVVDEDYKGEFTGFEVRY
ncbi:MAG: acylphosphatase [Candidatus Methanoperedens sp.]|jgi:acylphosphatase|nr:acylphosphatase [Candidatus Methanoperedens sp.]PKL53116.1 MAG: acylphosphatase [Candidatus Methanoperedenaceae archaeon HGW-Methanoperedenaceae-1]